MTSHFNPPPPASLPYFDDSVPWRRDDEALRCLTQTDVTDDVMVTLWWCLRTSSWNVIVTHLFFSVRFLYDLCAINQPWPTVYIQCFRFWYSHNKVPFYNTILQYSRTHIIVNGDTMETRLTRTQFLSPSKWLLYLCILYTFILNRL